MADKIQQLDATASEHDRDELDNAAPDKDQQVSADEALASDPVNQPEEHLISNVLESTDKVDEPNQLFAPEVPQVQDKLQDVSEGIRRVISALEHKDPELLKREPFSAQQSDTAHNKPVHFTKAVENIFSHSIEEDYDDLSKKSKNIAEMGIFSRKKTRKEQMGLIDDIREHLALYALDISSHDYDQDKALILYAVMKAIKEDLQKEFRWTKIFGTKSRLEIVLKEDMDAIQANFPNADFSEKNAKALMNKHLKKDPAIHQECEAILGHKKLPNASRSD